MQGGAGCFRDKGIHYRTKAYEISKAHGLKAIEGRALGFLATSYYDVREYEAALTYFHEVKAINESLNQSFFLARTNISIGCIYRELGDFAEALHYLHEGAEISAELQSSMGMARAYNELANTALEMVQEFKAISERMSHAVGIRVGIHCGSAIAGVIGSSKFSYDIWGDTVNLASRMESNGESGAIVTEAIYEALSDRYLFEDRGFINIKGKGEMQTYFLLGKMGE